MPVSSLPLEPLSPFGDALAGSLGAVFANTIVYPLDIAKTRIQVQRRSKRDNLALDGGAALEDGEHYKSALDAIQQILKKEGITGLYSGLAGGLVGTASQNFAYFYWYSFVRAAWLKRNPRISNLMELVLGAVAGALATIFTIPMSVITTRQQTASKARRKGLFGTVGDVIEEDGITGLWRGLGPSLILCVNPSLTYATHEILRKRFLGEVGKPSPGQSFLFGFISKTLATVVTYPYIMAKVRMQHKHEDPSLAASQRELSAIGILATIFKEDGFKGLYKGMSTQISKAVLTQAILFYFREIFTRYTMLAYALLRQARNNVKVDVAATAATAADAAKKAVLPK